MLSTARNVPGRWKENIKVNIIVNTKKGGVVVIMDKELVEILELQQVINKKDRKLIRELQEALLEKEKYGQLSPDTILKLEGD